MSPNGPVVKRIELTGAGAGERLRSDAVEHDDLATVLAGGPDLLEQRVQPRLPGPVGALVVLWGDQGEVERLILRAPHQRVHPAADVKDRDPSARQVLVVGRIVEVEQG